MLGSHIIDVATIRAAGGAAFAAVKMAILRQIVKDAVKLIPKTRYEHGNSYARSGSRRWFDRNYQGNYSGAKLARRAAAGTVGRARLK